MRSTRYSTPIRLACFFAFSTLPWIACNDLRGYQAGTEAASDAASGTGTAATTTSTTGTGGGGGGTGGGGGSAASIEARFELPAMGAPPFLDVPFPSDLYLDAKGHLTEIAGFDSYVPNNGSFLAAGLAPLDGFGTNAGAIFEIDDVSGAMPVAAAIDTKSLPQSEADSTSATASAMIVDLEATKAEDALVPARADYHDDTTIGAKTRPLLVVFPALGVVLKENHAYAMVLTTAIKTKDGHPLAPSATFAAIRDGKQRTTNAEKAYGGVVDKLAALVPALADKTKIAAVAAYHTGSGAKELVDLRADQIKAVPPNLSWDPAKIAPMGPGLFAKAPLPNGFTATLDDWLGTPDTLAGGGDDPADDQTNGRAHGAIGAIGTAVFDAPNYLVESPLGYNDPTHHTFARDADGKPIKNPDKLTSKVWMTIALPSSAVPAKGYPVVLVQHGIGGDRSVLLSIADTFAKRGWATAAIESVTFGARAAEPLNSNDFKAGFAWSLGAGAYNGPDGFVDLPNGNTDFFGSLKNLGSLRDQMRQSVLDIMVASDVLKTPALDLGPLKDAVPNAKLDTGKVVFLGNSLGGIMGSMVAAVDPGLMTFALNVPGGGLMTELGSTSPGIASSLKLAATLNFGFAKGRFAPSHPLLHIIQHIVDPGDPLSYAGHVVNDPLTINGAKNPPKSVLAFEVLFDETVSNDANEALARAMGLPLAKPNVGAMSKVPFVEVTPSAGVISGVPVAGVTSVLVQVGPATHGSDLFSRKGEHHYAHPFAQFDQMEPFTALAMPFTVAQPYADLQQVVSDYFDGAFTGAGAPPVKGAPPPVLDFDGDGFADDADSAPNDPTMH
ncbi:MAG: hypothetical protein U0359_13925 [Byssovorax sp.]